jgi:hypothetical protein
MPANIQQTVRRRGAISAEPINEEDAATYVKKVPFLIFWSCSCVRTAISSVTLDR